MFIFKLFENINNRYSQDYQKCVANVLFNSVMPENDFVFEY